MVVEAKVGALVLEWRYLDNLSPSRGHLCLDLAYRKKRSCKVIEIPPAVSYVVSLGDFVGIYNYTYLLLDNQDPLDTVYFYPLD